jgi:hypothetical protein
MNTTERYVTIAVYLLSFRKHSENAISRLNRSFARADTTA